MKAQLRIHLNVKSVWNKRTLVGPKYLIK